MITEQERQELEALRQENIQLKAQNKRAPSKLSLKVGKAGGLSVYGLGRFPTTLYKRQWIRLLEQAETIKAFIKDNESLLKDDK